MIATEVLAMIVSVCAAVISGLVLYFLQRHFRVRETKEQKKEERTSQKDILMIKSLQAIGELTVANAIALKEGKQNGEMHKAMDDFKKVDKELNNYLIQSSVQK